MRAKVWTTATTWTGAAGIAFALAWGGWREGLFFDIDLYPFEIFVIALAAVVGAMAAIGRRRGKAAPIPLPGWALLPFGLATAYGLHLLLEPASLKGTMDSFLRWTAYGCWFVLASAYLAGPAANRKAGWAALQLAAMVLILASWCGWFGWIGPEAIVYRSGQAELAATGARLAGLLQYPNAFGAAAAFFVLIEWRLLASKSRPAFGCAALMAVPALGALMLAESRGAALALAGAGALSLVLGGRNRWGYSLATAGVALACASAAANAAFGAMKSGQPASGAWALAAATIVGALLLLALRREAERYARKDERQGEQQDGRKRGRKGEWEDEWESEREGEWEDEQEDGLKSGRKGEWESERKSEREGKRAFRVVRGIARGRRFSFVSPGGGVVLFLCGCAVAYALLAGGDSGGARLDGHYETAAARGLYYADALRMFHDRPWLGAGGESWRMLMGEYKTVPYIGNEVHSGYLEILIDTGLLGIVLLAALLLVPLGKLRSRAAVAWPPAALLLAHAAIDFDWSYGYVWLLLLFWLALQLREGEAEQANARGRQGRSAAALVAALLIGFAAATLPAAWRSSVAASEREAALAAAPSARAEGLRAALAANPAWSRVRLELAPLLQPQERAELLAQGLRYDPQYPALEFQLGMAYAEMAQPEPAAAHLREALRLDRFDREAQNAAIATMTSMAERYAAAGRDDRAQAAAEAAAAMFEAYRELYRATYAGKANPWDDKELALFAAAKFNGATAMLLLGRQEEAAALLREVAEEQSEEWSRLAKEKLASLS
ncbi:O-antigen ligase family protein [Cohnella fermenti]|uniref:O-antigen ligase family protein n=1 Tax=Cohnella fermenti TaxID=2565925 RepID=A0A4S4BFT2_9BACL|nr:O-antigen ligase family protein [Cohnella fermenti]THF72999.1 O-antigen ligase family protein [Cohnella fermenti]